DIYSLGVLLYELLTGTTPLEADEIRSAGLGGIQKLIREKDSPRPSLRLSSAGERLTHLADQRSMTPGNLPKEVRGELDWIVMKSLAKERERRYDSVVGFADDVSRFLNGEAVHAYPPSTVYAMRKLIRRNKGFFLSLAVVFASLLSGIIGTTMQWKQSERERNRASKAESQLVIALDAQKELSRKAMEESERRRRLLYAADMNTAVVAFEQGDVRRAKDLLERHQDDLRGFEWHYVNRLCDEAAKATSLDLGYGGRGLALSPTDGKLVASLHNNSVAIIDPAKLEVLDTFGPRDRTWLETYVAFSPNGERLVVMSDSANSPQILDWPSCKRRWLLSGHTDEVEDAVFAPGGEYVATGDFAGEIRVWSLESGLSIAVQPDAHPGGVWCLAFVDDSTLVSGGPSQGSMKIWRLANSKLELIRTDDNHAGGVATLACSPDGALLASGGRRHILIHDLHRSRVLHRIAAHDDYLRDLTFSPDSRTLLSASRDKSIKEWDVDSGLLRSTKLVHSGNATSAIYMDGDRIASIGFDGTLAIHHMSPSATRTTLRTSGSVTDATFTNDGNSLLVVRADPPGILTFNLNDGGLDVTDTYDQPHVLAVGPSGLLAIGYADGIVRVSADSDLAQTKELEPTHSAPVWRVAISPKGDRLASLSMDGSAQVWDTLTNKSMETFRFKRPAVKRLHRGPLAFSPDGTRLAWGTGDHEVCIRDLRTNQTSRFKPHGKTILTLEFSPDGNFLATSDWGGTVALYELDSQEVSLIRHPTWIHSLAFSPDGESLWVSCGDNSLRVWDVYSRQQKCSFAEHAFVSMQFSPDGKRLVGVREDELVIVFTVE
ncbi:MAG: hypothetical protein KDB23_19015, partial [Planctomycetales bacterium]|nr:hypothetical protein [Planctomycetales bacterium]